MRAQERLLPDSAHDSTRGVRGDRESSKQDLDREPSLQRRRKVNDDERTLWGRHEDNRQHEDQQGEDTEF